MEKEDLISPGAGMSKEEFIDAVVSDCLSNLTDEDKKTLRKYPNPIDHHFGYGLYIRNHYKLWSVQFSELEPLMHPDDLSQEIVERIIKRVCEET